MNPAIDILRAVCALGFVLGLMWLLAYFLKKHGWRFGLPTALNTGRVRRLQLVEMLPVDHRHKLILVRRDNKEHLILLGAGDPEVIESDLPVQTSSSTPLSTEKS